MICAQGAQAVGMGAEAKDIPEAAALYEKAKEILGSVALLVRLRNHAFCHPSSVNLTKDFPGHDYKKVVDCH